MYFLVNKTYNGLTGDTVAPRRPWVPRRPPKKLRLPRRFLLAAFICWVCSKHAVTPQAQRLPRIFQHSDEPLFWWRRVTFKNRKILGRRCAWWVTACFEQTQQIKAAYMNLLGRRSFFRVSWGPTLAGEPVCPQRMVDLLWSRTLTVEHPSLKLGSLKLESLS